MKAFARLALTLTLMATCTLVPAIAADDKPSSHAVSLYNLGLTAYKQGSPESAIIFFRRATDLDPDLADAHYNLAVIYQSQKRYKEAIPRFEQVLRVKPTDADAHFQMGIILQESGRLTEAKDHLTNIAPNNPHFGEAQNRIAQINSQLSGGAQLKGQPVNGMGQEPAANTNYAGSQMNQSYQPITPTQTNVPNVRIDSNANSPYPAANTQSYQHPYQPQQAYVPQQANYPTQPIETKPDTPAPPIAPTPVSNIPNSSLRVIATGFSAPSGIAFDRQGNLYIANFTSNTIDRITADGSRLQFSAGINLKGPIGLVVDDTGNVYVANYNSGTIARINPAGVATIIASGFKKPYYLALDGDSNLYVSQQEDNSVVRISLPKPLASRVGK